MSLTPAALPQTPVQPEGQPPIADPALAGPPPTPQLDPATGEWFIEAPTGTRYRTADDASRGIAEKDTYIASLKSQLAAIQQAAGGGTPQAPAPPSYVNLLEQAVSTRNPKLFDDAIESAIDRRAEVLIQQRMGQINPLIAHAGLNMAVEIASRGPNGDPNIAAFVQSPAFEQVKAKFPVLANAVEEARGNAEFATSQLPQILQMAHVLSKALGAAPAATPTQRPPTGSTAPPEYLPQGTARRDALMDMPLEDIFGAR